MLSKALHITTMPLAIAIGLKLSAGSAAPTLCGDTLKRVFICSPYRGAITACDEMWVLVPKDYPHLTESMKVEVLEAQRLKKPMRFFYYNSGELVINGNNDDGVPVLEKDG